MTLAWVGAPNLPQVPFGRLFRRIDRAVPEGAEIVTAYTDGQVTLRSNRAKIGYHEAADLSGFKGVEVGDFVVHGLDILRGSVGIADSSGAITAVCTVCEPVADLDLRYVAHVIRVQAKSGFTKALARGIREGGADFRRWGTLAELPIPMPPVGYQRAVCDYIDRETARIDTLIEEQQRLIEMLRERRVAAIATSLDSTADHMTRLKHVSTVQTGVTLSGEGNALDPEWPYLRVANVQVGYVDIQEIKHLRVSSARAAASMLQTGDVLMTEGGDIDKLGRGALWRGELPNMLHQNHIFAVRPSAALDSEFLVYWLDGPVARTYFRTTAKQTTNLAGTNKWTLGNLPVPLPPIEDQGRTVALLDKQIARIDTLIAEVERFVELARERRGALITAAVTGQTDVREMA